MYISHNNLRKKKKNLILFINFYNILDKIKKNTFLIYIILSKPPNL